MNKAVKVVLIVLGSFVLLVALAAGGFAIVLGRGMDATQKAVVGTVDASGMADGTYEGSYGAGRFANQVSVTVADGKITGIDVRKTVQFDRPELSQALIDSVLARQNTDVDVQSGATLTSKAYLKSIEDALKQK